MTYATSDSRRLELYKEFRRRGHPKNVEVLSTLLAKRHALANFGPDNLSELQLTARKRLKSAQHRPNIIAACWQQAELW
jgi:hypothetical protein